MKSLNYRWFNRAANARPIVALHGFLGSSDDWAQLAALLPEQPLLAVDLPGHGGSDLSSLSLAENGFSAIATAVAHLLHTQALSDYRLLGYSLGGRIAMHAVCDGLLTPAQLLIESAHPGLATTAARQQRWQADLHWSQRLREQPLTQVLADWYRQPVFADLDDSARSRLIRARRHNKGPALAALLEATSLAKQVNLIQSLETLRVPMHYCCGQSDQKFTQLAQQLTLSLPALTVHSFDGCGHNVHGAAPSEFAQLLRQLS